MLGAAVIATILQATSMESVCDSSPALCREVSNIRLRRPDGEVVTLPFGPQRLPWVAPEGYLILFPGESVTVRLDPDETRLRATLVRGGAASAQGALATGEVRFAYRQGDDGAMRLTSESRVSGEVDYDVVGATPSMTPATPPVCPLLADRTSEERFVRPLYQVSIAGFRMTPAGAQTCTRAATPAFGTPPTTTGDMLTIGLGQTVTVRLVGPEDAPLPAVVTSSTAIAATPAEARLERALDANANEETLGMQPVAPSEAPQIAPGLVRYTLRRGVDGSSIVLSVQNGAPYPLDYQAHIRLADGRRGYTSICAVAAGGFVIEHWTDNITSIDLDRFSFRTEAGAAGSQAVHDCN